LFKISLFFCAVFIITFVFYLLKTWYNHNIFARDIDSFMIFNISNQSLNVKINTAGAEIISIVCHGAEYIKRYFDVLDGWAFNLFPIIGRLNQGVYTYEGKIYKLPRNGFLRQETFEVAECSKDSVTLDYKYNDKTLKAYPFKFLFSVNFRLIKNQIQITHKITNLDNKPMYFCLGLKPGFNAPLSEQLSFSDYYIEFGQTSPLKRLDTDSSFLLNGKLEPFEPEGGILPLRHKLFDNGAIIFADAPKSIALKTKYDSKSVRVSYPYMNYIALWKPPKTETPMICIEGWTGLPSYNYKIDDITAKEGVIKLNVKEEYINAWSIEIN
jgi:galactose mutarotase-like enzyme